MDVKKKGKKTINNEIVAKIAEIKKGESLIITTQDWKMKTRPGQNILRRRTGREFTVQMLKDETGWKITAL